MERILASDIGGTNSRFAVFESNGKILEMVDSIWLQTHGASSFSELMEQVWESALPVSPGEYSAAVIASAGAVFGGVTCPNLPNVPWGIDIRDVAFQAQAVCLINDFCAQAYACRTPAVDGARIIQGGKTADRETVGVIGAGTGLGYSALIWDKNQWTALPSEGGHMAFPFTGKEEAAYAEFNRRESGRNWPEGDSVVTGLGLSLVHQYLTGERLTPRDVSLKITPQSRTTQWYARFYGRACRNWALGVMARGGIYIAGGIAAKNPMFVDVPEFLAEFHNSHVYADFLQTVPILLNENEESGLYGAAFYGMQLLDGFSPRGK